MDDIQRSWVEQIAETQARQDEKLDVINEKVSEVRERMARLEGRAGVIGAIAGAVMSFIIGLFGGSRA